MATIAEELAIALGYKVDDTALEKHEKQARASAKRVGESWDKIGDAASKAAASAVGAVTAITVLAIKSAAAGSAIADLSARSGASTDDVQKLGHAMSQTGADAGTLGDVLKTLNKSVSDARAGSGPAADAFKLIGVSLSSLNGRGAQEQIEIIADGFAQIGDDATKTTAAMALFGDAGDKLVPLLSKGGAGVRGLGDELKMLGGVLDKDAIEKSAKFTAEVEKAKVKIGAFATDVGLKLIPLVESAAKDWDKWSVAVGGFGVAIGGLKLASLAEGLGLAGRSLSAIRWGAAIAGAGALGFALGTALDNALGLSNALAGLNTEKKQFRGSAFLGDLDDEQRSKLAAAAAERNRLQALLDRGDNVPQAMRDEVRRKRDGQQHIVDAITHISRIKSAHREGAAKGKANRARKAAEAKETVAALGSVAGDAARGLGAIGSSLGLTAGAIVENARNTAGGAFTKPKKKGKGRGKGKGKKGGVGDQAAAELAAKVAKLQADNPDLLDDIRSRGERFGATDKAIESSIATAAQAHDDGFATSEVRRKGINSLSGFVGADLNKKDDAIMSTILGTDQLPDVPISDLEQGQAPQVLQATINNTYTVAVNNSIDGAREPRIVAELVGDTVRSIFNDEIEKVAKFSKTIFKR